MLRAPLHAWGTSKPKASPSRYRIELLHRPTVAVDVEESRERPSLSLARPMADIISGGPKATNHSAGIRTEALLDLGLKLFFTVNARLELPRGHLRRVSPPFEGCKLLRLHLFRPCRWLVLAPCQPPNTTKLPKFSPMEVAQAGHHCKLELWVGVVHQHPVNLNLLLGGGGQLTRQAWGVDPFAFQKELLDSSLCTRPPRCQRQWPWHLGGPPLGQRHCFQRQPLPCLTK